MTCKEVCPKNAIDMVIDKKGFISPFINNNCIKCGKCEKYCPQIVKKSVNSYAQQYYAAKRKNEKLRLLSQSGGAFSVFAESVLETGGVVYGVSINKKLKPVYSRVDKLSKLQKLRGSKYAQACVDNIFCSVKQDLLNGKTVLFSGTPCHIHGLLMYLREKNICTDNLLTVDIICHGVVSPLIFQEYIEYTERRYSKKVRVFNFRDKQFGWTSCVTTARIGSFDFVSHDYVKIFQSDLALRDCCYDCRYTNLERVGDISIGDCWGIEKNNKEFFDNKGVSLVIVNSKKGENLFNNSKSDFDIISLEIKDYLQHNLQFPTARPERVDGFWADHDKYGFEYAAFKYCNFSPQNDYVLLKKNEYLKRFIRKMKSVL